MIVRPVGKKKRVYPHDPSKFESLDSYLKDAVRIINRYCRKNFKRTILQDEDGIALVAHYLMEADWRWDANHASKASRRTYRISCALGAISDYFRSYQRETHNKQYLVEEVVSEDIHEVEVCEEETERNTKFHSILQQAKLTELEERVLTSHYVDNRSLNEIAKDEQISLRKVQQEHERAIGKLRQVVDQHLV